MINCFGVPLSLLGRCHGEREGGERRGGIEDRLVDCIPELLACDDLHLPNSCAYVKRSNMVFLCVFI